MRIISSVTVITGVLAAAVTFAAAPPAVAGPVCNELDLDSPCVRSNDIRASIVLGGSTGDARLRLRNEDGADAVDLRASNGNVSNLFSNDEDESNGLVKAWARINADGTIEACWRCNTDTAETRRIRDGEYEVDFTPLATDITGRPMSGSIVNSGLGQLVLFNNNVDVSSILVTTFLSAIEDRAFVVLIY